MARKPDLPCADCGKLLWQSPGKSLPVGQACCQECRRARVSTCAWCGGPFKRNKRQMFCSPACFGKADGARRRLLHEHVPTSKDSRRQREADAPGLSQRRRGKLLAQWRARRTLCVYCRTALASTVDHVVPLILGGTNFEGNLVPACRRCNSSKADRLLVEWGARGSH